MCDVCPFHVMFAHKGASSEGLFTLTWRFYWERPDEHHKISEQTSLTEQTAVNQDASGPDIPTVARCSNVPWQIGRACGEATLPLREDREDPGRGRKVRRRWLCGSKRVP